MFKCCGLQQCYTTQEQSTPHAIGGDRDAHGCIAAAGYQLSQSRNSCVRVWEVGERLYRLAIGNTSTDIIIINDGNPIELFPIGQSGSVLLYKNGNFWFDSQGLYKVSKADLGVWELRDKDGILISKSKLPGY